MQKLEVDTQVEVRSAHHRRHLYAFALTSGRLLMYGMACLTQDAISLILRSGAMGP